MYYLNEVYYYLDYILQLYKEEFERILGIFSIICENGSLEILSICRKYVCKSDIDKYLLVHEDCFIEEYDNEEVKECIKNIIDLENNAIRECLDLKYKGELFCDKCAPVLCLSPKKE